ncbi:MAG: DUF2834 domain-containing protein [Streptosporangiaceae bacterium]
MLSTRDRLLCGVYALIALVALIATWSQNIRFFRQADNGGITGFLDACYANAASSSITNDIVLVALAAAVLMVVEARRLGIRFVWAYVIGSALIAISVTFPLFLIARQVRLAQRDPG